ncbi:uncharacterized protein LOC115030614 [Mus caroli]|uniref:Uncharacterized protein LOC115030614 n=1 Tax=Mus caroli TaxID=10089 RepID=A0A6P7QZK8_MUSCR|nr:uncharacterized protein LOC115030614 [Mus caroli]
MISPGAGPGVEVEVAATLKCCGARARVLSTQGFAAAPQLELCGLRSGCGRRACDLARSGENGALFYFILFSRSWTFSELALAPCPALCGRPCSEFRSQAASYACANAGWHRRAPACLCALLGTDSPGARARPDFSRPCVRACLAQTRRLDALWTAGHSVGAKRARPCVSGARGCPSRRAGQRPGLARDSRVSVSARLQPAWRLRGRGPAGTREPGTTPGRAPDDRDGTVLWSGRRAHPADVPEPPSAAANRGEAPLLGGRRGRSTGHARPAAPPRLMRRALRPLGAPGRRRGGRGFQMHGRFPLTAGTGDHSTWIPQVSMAATLRCKIMKNIRG